MKRHALFIGIDRYEDAQLRSLDCAEEDAVELHGFFKHRAGYHAQCLRSPSSAEVLETVERLVAGLAPGDLFLFFFAGHGVTHAGQHLLLCAKARHSRLHHKQEVVPVDLLKEETARPGVHRVFVLDACRSDLLKTRHAGNGGFTGSNALRDVVSQPGGKAGVSDGSLTLVCSCDEGGQASEINALKGGVFRLALLETFAAAVREERELALGESLISEVEQRMSRLAATHGIATRQRPWFQRAGEAPLLLAGRPIQAKPPAQTVPAAAPVIPPVETTPMAEPADTEVMKRVPPPGSEPMQAPMPAKLVRETGDVQKLIVAAQQASPASLQSRLDQYLALVLLEPRLCGARLLCGITLMALKRYGEAVPHLEQSLASPSTTNLSAATQTLLKEAKAHVQWKI